MMEQFEDMPDDGNVIPFPCERQTEHAAEEQKSVFRAVLQALGKVTAGAEALLTPKPYINADESADSHYRGGLESYKGVGHPIRRAHGQATRFGRWAVGKAVNTVDYKITKRGKHDR